MSQTIFDDAHKERSYPGMYMCHCVYCMLEFGGPKWYSCCRKCKDIQLAVIAKGTEMTEAQAEYQNKRAEKFFFDLRIASGATEMSQTQTVEEAFEAFKVKANWPHAIAAGCIGTAFKAGYELAAKTPAECAVIEAAIDVAEYFGAGESGYLIPYHVRMLINAVAALEREKVEGGSSG